jgi:hypothetical protein
MNNRAGFVLKILVLSAILAIAIKYVAPYFNIPATSTIALISVLLPTGVMGVALSWRAQRQS